MDYPKPVQDLIGQLVRLPSLGRRSAERIVLHLLQSGPDTSRQLAEAILQMKQRIRNCSRCGGYTEHDPCEVCISPRRDSGCICVVEGPNDILNVERTGAHRGVYHALMGRLSPLNDIGPDQLRIAALLERVQQDQPAEVILALGADLESETTAHYLADLLKPTGVKVSRIGLGLPAGSTLEGADEVTVIRALEGRRSL